MEYLEVYGENDEIVTKIQEMYKISPKFKDSILEAIILCNDMGSNKKSSNLYNGNPYWNASDVPKYQLHIPNTKYYFKLEKFLSDFLFTILPSLISDKKMTLVSFTTLIYQFKEVLQKISAEEYCVFLNIALFKENKSKTFTKDDVYAYGRSDECNNFSEVWTYCPYRSGDLCNGNYEVFSRAFESLIEKGIVKEKQNKYRMCI